MNGTPAPSAIEALNAELRAADESLVGNEDLLRAVLSGCGDCIKILDLDGNLQFMSDGGKRVMEVDDFSALKGCPWPDFWAGSGNASAREAVAGARQGRIGRFKGPADTAKGNARYWDVQVSPIMGAGGAVTHLLSISRDVTAEWQMENTLKEAAERQYLLSAEMNHRIGNTIAVIGAIASQTFRGDDMDSARANFMSRLTALGDANKLLLQSGLECALIEEVVQRALAPHDPGGARIRMAGAAVQFPAKQALSLAIALHELATNASKYGALSNEDGLIDIEWKVEATDPEAMFVFRWTESGGPRLPDAFPERTGFGSRLIQNVVTQDFRGALDVSYNPSGLVCEVRAPMRALVDTPN